MWSILLWVYLPNTPSSPHGGTEAGNVTRKLQCRAMQWGCCRKWAWMITGIWMFVVTDRRASINLKQGSDVIRLSFQKSNTGSMKDEHVREVRERKDTTEIRRDVNKGHTHQGRGRIFSKLNKWLPGEREMRRDSTAWRVGVQNISQLSESSTS